MARSPAGRSPTTRASSGAPAAFASIAALASLGLSATACRPTVESESSADVRVDVSRETWIAELRGVRGEARAATLIAAPDFVDVRALVDGAQRRGPFAIALAYSHAGKTTPLRLHRFRARRREDGVAVAQALISRDEGDDGVLTATLDPSVSGLSFHAHLKGFEPGTTLVLRARAARRGSELQLGDVPPERAELPLAKGAAPWLRVGRERPLVIAGSQPLSVEATTDTVDATVERAVDAAGAGDLELSLSIAADPRAASALGARTAKATRRKGAELAVEVRDAASGRMLPARIMVEGTPRVPLTPDANGTTLVLDPSREAEAGAPLVDAYRARTSFALPAGRWTLLTTHGLGWSIAKTTLDLEDGDAVRVPVELAEEASFAGWIGCDLHVHARGSTDARAVSYEDRVRSLAAVGVDCAAATEHDHVDSHAPAALKLGLEPLFRGAQGVELTTSFGHFNAYPWPDGTPVPTTKGTTPRALFDAVHALPSGRTLVLQVNHPRMRAGEGSKIGYFELSGYDGAKRLASGGSVEYLEDYDALEVFNGYQLPFHEAVLAMVDEWIAMLDLGDVHVATGSSDSHWIQFPWAGFPRTYVRVGPTWSADGRPFAAVARALKQGRAMVTSGPLIDVHVGEAGIGDTASVGAGAPGVSAHVEVRLSSWLGEPTLDVRLGRERLPATLKRAPGTVNGWVADVALPKVATRRPLVAIATAKVLDDGRIVKGLTTGLGFTNPVWLVP
jgi:hypothetical protein